MNMRERIYEVTVDGNTHRVHRHGTNMLQVEGANGARKYHPHEAASSPYLMTVSDEFIVTAGLTDKYVKFWRIRRLLDKARPHDKPYYCWK